jgi:hypothetical protein
LQVLRFDLPVLVLILSIEERQIATQKTLAMTGLIVPVFRPRTRTDRRSPSTENTKADRRAKELAMTRLIVPVSDRARHLTKGLY